MLADLARIMGQPVGSSKGLAIMLTLQLQLDASYSIFYGYEMNLH